MSIELPKDMRKEAVASIVRYFRENREEENFHTRIGRCLQRAG